MRLADVPRRRGASCLHAAERDWVNSLRFFNPKFYAIKKLKPSTKTYPWLRKFCRPIGNFSPFPLAFPLPKEGISDCGGEWDVWARNQVASVGSDVHGKFALLQVSNFVFSQYTDEV